MKMILLDSSACDLCRKCELACSVFRLELGEKGPLLRVWRQCEVPPCVDACIGEALFVDEGEFVRQNPDRCVGCLMCNMVCPEGAIVPSYAMIKALKCSGQCTDATSFEPDSGILPPCVAACPRGALMFDDPQRVAAVRRRKRVAARRST